MATGEILRKTTKSVWFACLGCGKEADAPLGTKRATEFVCRECFGRGKDKRPRELNDLSGAEWAKASLSVEAYPDVRSEKQREHGACFPESLASQQIGIYTRKGETVLDPFLGVGTTMDAALKLHRKAIGIEINPAFANTALRELEAKNHKCGKQFSIHVGDAREVSRLIKANTIDFVMTSPPYSSLLKNIKGNFAFKWREHSTISPVSNPRPYSEKSGDLGNMPYDEYLTSVSEVFRGTLTVLKPGSYAVWVVKDYRNLKNGVPYVNLHGDVISCATQAGFTLWDIRIFDQTKFRPLVCLGFPSRNFYLNVGHSYILVFKKVGKRGE